ncbi:hypothetical protein QBZ16_000034 [Prototheca wickerhamii]|uniref:Ion transport domain-containing protein n=1 Tax=Prototheca wickerhamii TaxID=3111 RepID=A0AAD9IKI9_PROWI|nr:hypothetical protein QBZ16_000034 [Prototheca wickerhamii]
MGHYLPAHAHTIPRIPFTLALKQSWVPLGTHGETVDPDVEERLIAQADQEEPDPELQAVATDTVSSLLHHRQSEVLKFLQTKGVHKLAEFDVEENMVFPAFKQGPMLTLGSDELSTDAEWEWNERLRQYSDNKPTGWHSSITLEAFVIPIAGAANPGTQGLLHHLVHRYLSKRCSYFVFALPAVQAIITYKWTHYARKWLFVQLALYFAWLLCFYGFIIAFQGEDLTYSLRSLLDTRRGQVTVALEIGALVCMLPFVLVDLTMLVVYKLQSVDLWFILGTITYAIQIAVSVVHLSRCTLKSDWLTILLAAQCILLLFRVQYWARAFNASQFAFVDVVWEVIDDTSGLLVFLFMVMAGYGAAFHITFRIAEGGPDEYKTIWRSVLSMYEHVYGDLELKDFYSLKHMRVFATVLAVSYIFIQGFVLVNLLIGAIVNSLERIMEHATARQLASKARLIDEVETTMQAFDMAGTYLKCKRQWFYPKFVHVLRINPEKLDPVEADQLARQVGHRQPARLRHHHKKTYSDQKSQDEEGSSSSGSEASGGEASGALSSRDVDKILRQQEEILRLLRGQSGK